MRKVLLQSVAAVLITASPLLNAAESQFQARLVAEINPGAAGSFPEEYTAFGDALYFKAYTVSTGWELWRLRDGTVTLAADINPTANDLGSGVMVGNDSHPSGFIAHDQLYFTAFEPRRGGELWRFDGSQASRVADINPDQNDTIKTQPNSSWPNELTLLNGVLYFSANSGAVRENYELWSYNGAEVREAANIRPDSGPAAGSSYPTGLTVFGGSLFFMADDGANGYELWKHSGTQTTLLNINPGGATSSSFPKFFTAGGNHLYFQAFHTQHGY
jgi:ELWxxDGT repeat protein